MVYGFSKKRRPRKKKKTCGTARRIGAVMSIKLKVDNITPSLSKIQSSIPNVVQSTYKYFVSVTPKDKGNARNKTKLQGNTINADYPYAQRLNKGWSKQAPKGMVAPTIEFLKRALRRIVRK